MMTLKKSLKVSFLSKKPKVLFMGTPEFCLPTLKALHESDEIELSLVVTQPDSPRGRKLKLQPSPVKAYCLEKNIEVLTPEKVSTPEMIEKLKSYDFDVAIVLAYGQLLKQSLLDILPDRFINIHASLLPRWRGAAPIQRAVMSGDEETGLAFQLMRLKLDSGPVILSEKTKIQENEDSIELMNRLSDLSGRTVVPMLLDYLNSKLEKNEQDESQVTYAKKIKKEEGLIDWSKPAVELHNQIRGLQWGPGAYTLYNGKRLKISKTEVMEGFESKPGVVFKIEDNAVFIGTSKSSLKVSFLQPEGRAKMDVDSFVNGYGLTLGFSFLKS